MPRNNKTPATPPAIDSAVQTLRSGHVILDADLAKIYGVTTKAFNQAVRQSHEKFPSRFFQLSVNEAKTIN